MSARRPVAGVRPAEPREAETWRSRARTLVRGVLAMCRYRGDDAAQTRAELRRAYPWPDSTTYRRRIWSEEVAIALGKRRRRIDPRERQGELDLDSPALATHTTAARELTARVDELAVGLAHATCPELRLMPAECIREPRR